MPNTLLNRMTTFLNRDETFLWFETVRFVALKVKPNQRHEKFCY